jgi:hypothetical protein
VPTATGVLPVKRKHLARTAIVASDRAPFALEMHLKRGVVTLDGSEAMRAAGLLMPAANRFGGGRQEVQGAVARIEDVGDPAGFLATVARSAAATRAVVHRRNRWSGEMPNAGLLALQKVDRLAIEMALQEDAERRAMEGELAELEAAWRQAEEIAAIADNLLVEPGVTRALDALKQGAR